MNTTLKSKETMIKEIETDLKWKLDVNTLKVIRLEKNTENKTVEICFEIPMENDK